MADVESSASRHHSRAQWRAMRRRANRTLSLERGGHVAISAVIDVAGLLVAGSVYDLTVGGESLVPLAILAFAALSLGFLAAQGVYRKRLSYSVLNELPRVVAATGISAAIITFASILLGSDTAVADQTLTLWMIAASVLCTARSALRLVEITRWAKGKGGHPTLILGAGKVGHLIARRLLDKPEIGLRPVGFVDDMPMEASDGDLVPILGSESDLQAIVLEHEIEYAIFSFSASPHERTLQAARRLDELGVTVSLVPRLFEGIPDRTVLDRIAGVPLISVFPTDPRGWQLSVKYAADKLIALVALILLSPILLLAALAVRIDLGRPILFRQNRVGIDGKEFTMLKFRTMRGHPSSTGQANYDWASAVIEGEKGLRARPVPYANKTVSDRVTRVGRFLRKTAIDELPQLINVAKGEMSLIGPRPEMPDYAGQFADVIHRYGDRHRVKSGITGWAQVHGLRGRTSLSDRVEWDNYYIENWSPWLDLRIALMTLMTIIRDPSE